MTAFAESGGEHGGVAYRLRISSVNSRALDLRLKLPFELAVAEAPLREFLQGKMRRGKVDVQLYRDRVGDKAGFFNPDFVLSFLQNVQSFVAEHYQGVKLEQVFPVILQSALSGSQASAALHQEVDTAFTAFMLDLAADCLKRFDVSAAAEGSNLEQSLAHELSRIQPCLDCIASISGNFAVRLQEHWDAKLQPLCKQQFDCELDEKRLYQELLFYLEKKDITEELVRFKSHLAQFSAVLADVDEYRKGKKFEFILQEMLREANTIGSKSSEIEIIQAVIEVKSTLEKLREQVQNVC